MTERWTKLVNILIVLTLAILLLNPSGVVGRWIAGTYGGWDERRRVGGIWDELLDVPSRLGSPPAQGRGSIVEFVDYDCPVCRTVAPDVLAATRTQGVSVVVRHVPSERNGVGATEAALAVICAERYGRFPEAHTAMLSDDTWISTRDWPKFGSSLGLADTVTFAECMGEEATRTRLDRDRKLANALRIAGTPTFVSPRGLHLGAPGLPTALAVVADGGGGVDPVPLRVAGEATFDSSDQLGLPELLSVVAGFFLPDSAVALVERNEIYVVDLPSGRSLTVGRAGEGPEEFGYIWPAKRVPGGIMVSDVVRRRVSVITPGGEFRRSQGYLHVALEDFAGAYPVGIHPDGRVVFRDGIEDGSGNHEGRVWNPARYVAVGNDGALEIVAEAKGNEVYFGSKRSGDVVFGHRTFEAATEEHLIVGDTNQGVISVLDWNGRGVAEIPMSSGIRVQEEEGRQVLFERWKRFEEELSRAAAAGYIPLEIGDGGESPESHPDWKDWPMNEVAPAIDTLLTDFDGRLWTRDYRLPNEDSVTWRVWDVEEQKMLFTARMAGEDVLLDAQEEFVLLRRVNELDVPRGVIVRLAQARR